MNVWIFLIPWILVGLGVVFVAFSGGPGRARDAYLTKGNRAFQISILVIYLGIGVAVPAIILASRTDAQGATSSLQTKHASANLQDGKTLFRSTCASCHTLAAVNARGVTGPDLDRIGLSPNQASIKRVENAIRIGGTGQGRMPSGLLQGQNAQEVAEFVTTVAGQ
ncbi:MAG TPA: c-type cytochrome [Thermoleophilaceae bacterium]|jgi:mono/diheme cytochrome c family protein